MHWQMACHAPRSVGSFKSAKAASNAGFGFSVPGNPWKLAFHLVVLHGSRQRNKKACNGWLRHCPMQHSLNTPPNGTSSTTAQSRNGPSDEQFAELVSRAKKESPSTRARSLERAVFVAEQAGVDADALVVLDEFGSNLDLTRRFGRSKRGTRLEAIIAARGCRIWYLPPHSPDFSPIELAFAKVKGELRRLKARTTEILETRRWPNIQSLPRH